MTQYYFQRHRHVKLIMETHAATAPVAQAPVDTDAMLMLKVSRKEIAAQGIYLFELSAPDGSELPEFTAGSHIVVETPNKMRRSYSLCNAPAERHRYLIAVKRDEAGRGGSMSMADEMHVGQQVRVGLPRNEFELSKSAKEFVFIAGGIGITPILSMMRHLKHTGGGDFKLYYLARDKESAAFLDEINAEFPGQLVAHHDHGNRDNAFNLWLVLGTPTRGHVYCCGPKPLMDSVRGMTGHWPSENIHFESFGAETKSVAENAPFTVRLVKSNETLEVGARESILDALRRHGHRVASSCEAGTCGSCRVGLLAGEVDHRDLVLDEDEQQNEIMICVSRAKSAQLDLDL